MINIEVQFRYCCDVCGESGEKNMHVPYESPMPILRLPDGWRVIDGAVVCPKHSVRFETNAGGDKL